LINGTECPILLAKPVPFPKTSPKYDRGSIFALISVQETSCSFSSYLLFPHGSNLPPHPFETSECLFCTHTRRNCKTNDFHFQPDLNLIISFPAKITPLLLLHRPFFNVAGWDWMDKHRRRGARAPGSAAGAGRRWPRPPPRAASYAAPPHARSDPRPSKSLWKAGQPSLCGFFARSFRCVPKNQSL